MLCDIDPQSRLWILQPYDSESLGLRVSLNGILQLRNGLEIVEVHHIRALRDLNVKGQGEKPLWIQVMAARQRKTFVVCCPCHLNAHGGDWKPRKQK